MEENFDDILDAEKIKYPCNNCKRKCHGRVCNQWKEWFREKWHEIRSPLDKYKDGT